MKLVSKGFLFLAPLALLARELLEIISFFWTGHASYTLNSLTFQNGFYYFIMEMGWFTWIFCFLLGACLNLFVKD